MASGMKKYDELHANITPPADFSIKLEGKYRSKKELLSKEAAKTVNHPITGRLVISEWVNASPWKLFASGTNENGEEFFLCLKLNKTDSIWSGVLTAHPMNKKLKEMFESSLKKPPKE